MNGIANLISELETAREFFAGLAARSPDFAFAQESLMACDILLVLLRQPDVNPNHCAFFAGMIVRKFSWSIPPLLTTAAQNVVQWAREQPRVVKYRRQRGIPPFTWTVEAP